MTDLVDRAQEAEEQYRQDALRAHRERASRVTHARRQCADCGTTIPQRRLEALPGATRCTPCQSATDRRKAR